jgi:Phage stabilisation protein
MASNQRLQHSQLQTEDIIRIPLVSPYNTRNLDLSNNSSTGNGLVGVGVVGVMVVGATGTSVKDKKFINCFAEMVLDRMTQVPKYYVTKRPGWASYVVPAAGQLGTAIKVWAVNVDKVISAFGSTNSTVYDGVTSLGAITGKVIAFEETAISGTPYMVMSSTDNTAWYTTGGAPTQITDVDFPGNAGRTITGGFVFVDGFAFIMDTGGRIYNSDLNSIVNWTAGSFQTANMYPDNGVGLARYKNMIVAFGKETVEFFYNSGQNPVGSPLDRYEQGFVHFGCLNQYAYTQLEDTVAWVSASDRSGLAVYMLDGLQPKRISTPYIDTQLAFMGTDSIFVSSAKLVGKTFVTVAGTATTFVYVVEDDMWHEWTGPATLWHHITGTSAGTRLLFSISRSDTGGKIFTIDPSNLTYQDNALPYTMTCQTTKFDGETMNFKFLYKLSMIADTTPTVNALTIVWSDDDYQTWSAGRTIDLNSNNPYIMNCGRFRRRAFKFVNSVNNPVRLEAMELQVKTGIH